MSVDDSPSMIRRGLKELFANPDEIILYLMLECHARSDAGMHEQVVAAAIDIAQALKE